MAKDENDRKEQDELDRTTHGVLGNIDPAPSAREPMSGGITTTEDAGGSEESMDGGSGHDRTDHSGSRDVTEGVTGGTGTEVGGTRNYRQGTGATGGDIGNRPE
jgi:hypothetical protein